MYRRKAMKKDHCLRQWKVGDGGQLWGTLELARQQRRDLEPVAAVWLE